MEIKLATDWSEVRGKLLAQMLPLPFNNDLLKLLSNVDSMVSALSKLEVEARRLRAPYKVKDAVDEINNAIKHLEQLLIVAKLIY